jgi:hypothetical protein
MLTRYSLVPLVALFFMPAIGGRALVPVRTGGMSHLITSLHLRGGKSLGGQGTNLGAGGPESQGVQLPLLRNVLDMATSLSTASNSSNASALPSLDPDRMAFLQNAFAEMLENTTDVFTTSITRLSLPEDCEANISLKERALFAIAGWPHLAVALCLARCVILTPLAAQNERKIWISQRVCSTWAG